jgi:hypothetical protein
LVSNHPLQRLATLHTPIFDEIKKMKKAVIILLAVLVLGSCSLTSRTTIGPKKAFELGDGRHGSFKAVVKNDSDVAVDIYQVPLGGAETRLITLQPGQQKTVRFDADTKAIFKNTSSKEAALVLKVTGDTGLTMGGANY